MRAGEEKRVAKIVQLVWIVGGRRDCRSKPTDRAIEIAALREQRSKIVVGFGEIRLQYQSILECGARLCSLAAFGEQRPEMVQRGSIGARLRRPLECRHGSAIESVVEQLAAVRQVIAQLQSRIELS